MGMRLKKLSLLITRHSPPHTTVITHLGGWLVEGNPAMSGKMNKSADRELEVTSVLSEQAILSSLCVTAGDNRMPVLQLLKVLQ